MTYTDARRWGQQIERVTQSRYMPPWLPEPGYGDFADNRRLSDADLKTIQQWAATGMAQGDLADAPRPPHYDATWQLGTPDLILKIVRPFTLISSGSDVFRNFVLPYPLKQTHYIRALEIRPGTQQVVHHANLLIDRTASFRRAHPNDWQDGIAGMELEVDAGTAFDPDSHFLFWKPDTRVLTEPEGMPWRLDPGNDLILNMHLKPSGKSETMQAEIGLYFSNEPPEKQPMLLQLEDDAALDIPAGTRNFVVQDEIKFRSISMFSVSIRMRTILGKTYRVMPFCRLARRSGLSGFAIGISTDSQFTVTVNLFFCLEVLSSTCVTPMTIRAITSIIRLIRRFV